MDRLTVLSTNAADERYELRLAGPGGGDAGYARMATLVRLLGAGGAGDVPITQVEQQAEQLLLAGATPELAARAIWRPRPGRCRSYAVTLELTYYGEQPAELGVQVRLELQGPGRPTWLIPGAFYKENRFAHCARIYPRYDYDGGDPARLVSQQWSFRADRAATPVVFGWNGALCAALCTEERSPLGLSGLGFVGSADDTAIWLNFPYREEPVVFDGSTTPQPADIQHYRWQPGQSVRLEFTVYIGTPDSHAYDPFLREIYRRQQQEHQLRPWMGLQQAAELTAHGLYRWHYQPEHHALYETIAFDRELNNNAKGQGDRPHMHVAWVSGAPYAYALLRYGRDQGRAEYVDAAEKVLDLISTGIAPCGAFWAEWTLERGWGTGWNPRRDWLQARTLAEATLFMVRALVLERERGFEHPAWRDAALSNLRFALEHQRADGSYGSYYHCQTGQVEEWDGAGGVLWIAALLEGAAFFNQPAFRRSAVRAGAFYQRFVLDDLIYGAPEDVHLAPTSEDSYNAMVAYLLLYEAERDEQWLQLASRAADWMMTWRWSYNIAFSPRSMLGQLDFRSRGADQASPSNQHLHNYGLFCLPELLRLWSYTGDDYYLQRGRDNLAFALQCIAREDGDFNAYKGMVTERYYNTNCFQPKGMLLTISHAWSVGLVLYACQAVLPFEQQLGLSELLERREAGGTQ